MAERSVLAAVLAGGLGSRLGGAKAAMPLAGKPLVSYPLAAARAAGLDAVVVAKPATELPDLGVPVVREPEEPRHPLCGVLAALGTGRGEDGGHAAAVLALACDMPFVDAALVGWLAGLQEAVVLEANDRLQPFPGLYPASAHDTIARAVQDSEPTGETLASLAARRIGERELARFGDPARLLFNVNEPSDVLAAERMLASAER